QDSKGVETDKICHGGKTAFIDVAVVSHYGAAAVTSAVFKAPQPDLRIAFDFTMLKGVAAGFNHYKVGQWVRLGEAPWYCGDRTPFDIVLREPPALTSNGWLNPDGNYGTTIGLSGPGRAQIHG